MRKLLIVVAVLIMLVIAGVAVFIATFNADRYRPLVVEQLSQAAGRPVSLQRLSLAWRGGLALEARGLVVGEADAPALEVERVGATLKLLPLLRREVRVGAVRVVRPRVRLSRDAEGHIDILGLAAVGGPAAAQGRQAAVGGVPVTVAIESLRIEDGQVRWMDATVSPPRDVTVDHLDCSLAPIDVARPITLSARAAVFSEAPNVRLSGRVQLPRDGQPGRVEDVELDVDLGRMDLRQLRAGGPSLRALAGTLALRIDHAALDPSSLAGLRAHLRLKDGSLSLSSLANPVERIEVEAVAQADRLELTRASASLAGGTIEASGVVEALSARARSTLKLSASNLDLTKLLPAASLSEPQLRGVMAGSFDGAASGLAWPEISQTLRGQGRLTITHASIANLNLLRAVFERLSMLPGVVQRLEARLPESSRAKLRQRDTVLEPIELSVSAADGALTFQELRLRTDTVELIGPGRIGLDGLLLIQPFLWIEPELSSAMIGSVNELQYLADANGRVGLPVTIQGQLLRIAVAPDVGYVAQRVLVSKGTELLGDFLRRALEKGDGEQQQPEAAPQ